MPNLLLEAQEQLQGLVAGAARSAMQKGALPEAELPAFTVEIPADPSHGDFAANAAMVWARALKLPPRKIAEAVAAQLELAGSCFDRWEIAGPGFLNFFLAPGWYAGVVKEALDRGADYGRSDYGRGEKVMVEFVSANPTGPMHMGNARGGSIGDVLADTMKLAGFDVTKEFYINDAGNQIAKFGRSLAARYRQIYLGEEAVPFPEDGYHGEDITERARQYAGQYGDSLMQKPEEEMADALVAYALPLNIEKLRTDLEKYRIVYDVWFHESELHETGQVQAAIQKLADKGLTYEKDGALWYRATQFGAEKDEVLVRQGGSPTYFAADIAYHYNKFAIRGFARCINVWGADHHGHVARLKGAMDAIGLDGSKLDIVLMQLVRLMKDGEPYKMSKRSGKAITLSDLIEEVPVDAARFFFNLREPNSTLDFDLDLAVEQSSQNPVYYVQYAHARICSILKNLAAEGISPRACTAGELCRLTQPEELALIRRIAAYPREIIAAAKNYDPARMTRYAMDLAADFHKYYNSCRVKCEDEPLMQARLALCLAARQVLKNDLALLKITAPESM